MGYLEMCVKFLTVVGLPSYLSNLIVVCSQNIGCVIASFEILCDLLYVLKYIFCKDFTLYPAALGSKTLYVP